MVDVKDGNDLTQVLDALNRPLCRASLRGIICHTVKGKGVFYGNQSGWHGKAPSNEQARAGA